MIKSLKLTDTLSPTQCHIFFLYIYYNTSMLRLAYVFFIIQSLYVVVDFLASNAFVTSAPPPPSTLNCLINLRNEGNHILKRAFPSFTSRVIFKFVVTSTISIFLLFRIFLHLCIAVKYVVFTTNLTLFRKNKTTSTLTPSSMTPLLTLLLLGLLSAEFPENYLPLIFILPNSEYGFMLSLALKYILALQSRKTLFQLLFNILSIYIP